MHRLLARQLAKATSPSGEVDIAQLRELISTAYEQADSDRRRTDRSISLMVEELDQLNRGLEQVVTDRTAELRDREYLLADQNILLDAALNNMSQGLLMFDPQTRIMIYNRRYLDIYGLQAADVRVGMTLEELLRQRVINGTYNGDPASYAADVRKRMEAGETYSRFTELPDGRTVSVVSSPIDNGGWVVTHEDISERRRAEKQIAHMAHHDALTDLPNRVLFRERLEQALTKARRGNRIAVLYLDLDNFKGVNDTFGHQAGDALLKSVAFRLRSAVRETDTVARVGGDEFAIIQVSADEPGHTAALATHICDALGAPYELCGNRFVTDVSIGIAQAPQDGDTADELLKNADLALYRAKADGRGTFRFFEPAMDARVRARRALENELRQALSEGQFTLHYQPIFNLKESRVSCCEALARWHHPERGMIPPMEFISVAEEIGLINALGEWVLRKACTDAANWPDDVKVAVNLS
ncbi:MAG: diguanylate cyclase, partial [Pseudolabrys sp.]|nr:diguanylate cyclase [Pseudolabrys sp.]